MKLSWFSVQIPSNNISQYTAQVLGVILALLDDLDESVQLTAVSCLLMVIHSTSLCLCFFLFLMFLVLDIWIHLLVSIFAVNLRFSSRHPMMLWNLFCWIFLCGSAIFKCVYLLSVVFSQKLLHDFLHSHCCHCIMIYIIIWSQMQSGWQLICLNL